MIIGYRTKDSSFNKILVPFKDVLEYETKELGNVDIYLTMYERYNLNIDLRWGIEKCNNIILDFFRKKYKGVEPVCIWLCKSIYDVEELYAKGNEEIIRVILPDNAVMASNMGYEGCLYVIHIGQTYSWNYV